jgi:hypothetical protein
LRAKNYRLGQEAQAVLADFIEGKFKKGKRGKGRRKSSINRIVKDILPDLLRLMQRRFGPTITKRQVAELYIEACELDDEVGAQLRNYLNVQV